jgi:hypothetical protein
VSRLAVNAGLEWALPSAVLAVAGLLGIPAAIRRLARRYRYAAAHRRTA